MGVEGGEESVHLSVTVQSSPSSTDGLWRNADVRGVRHLEDVTHLVGRVGRVVR